MFPAAPRVGVIIANFNNQAYVGQAIRSVATQTFGNFSAIVVDNCSTDSSDSEIKNVLRGLEDTRFRYFRNDYNRGQAGAIRTGLVHLVDASFVCVLDSDDYLYEDFIVRHVEAHLNADFSVALSYSDSHIVDGQGRLLAGTAWWFDAPPEPDACRRIDPLQVPRLDCQSGNMHFPRTGALRLNAAWAPDQSSNSMTSMMLRRPFIDLVLTPADEELKLYADYYFSTLAGLLTGTIGLADALYAYRMHGANSHSNENVVGGRYSSSTKPWAPIQRSVWELVLRALADPCGRIERSFGVHKVRQARKLVQLALAKDAAPGWRARIARLQTLLTGGEDPPGLRCGARSRR